MEKALAEGASVSIIDVEAEAGHALINALSAGDRCHFGAGNVTVADDIARVHAEAVKRFGPVTGLVNDAGRNSYADAVTMTERGWDDVFSVDLKAAWLVARRCCPA